MSLQNEIMELEAQLQQLESERTAIQHSGFIDPSEMQRITDQINIIMNRLNEKRAEYAEHAERIQTQQEQIDGLEEAVFALGLFEAIKGQPNDGERIYEYDEHRKEFNFIIIDFFQQQIQKVHEQHNAEIGAKDDKIRVLTMQGMETENQLAEAKKDITEKSAIISILEAKAQEDEQVRIGMSAQISELQAKVDELQSKLEAQKPKEYAPPSQDLADRVAKLSQKSGMKTQLEIAMERYNIELPELNPTQETPFRNEITTTESSGDQLHTTDTTEAVGGQFQSEENTAEGNIDGLAMGPLPLAGETTAVTREEFEALKQDVAQLKRTVLGEVAA